MNCNCGGDTKVISSTEYQGQVFRKRKCVECGEIFATREYTVPKKHSVVVAAFREKQNRQYRNRKRKELENERAE